MASFNRFEAFSEALVKKEHNLHTDTLSVYLTDNAPSAAADAVKADLVESLSTANGYTAGGIDTQNTVSRTGAVSSIVHGTDPTWTATGAGFGPFRYAVLYNDTHASDALIGWWDYAASISLAAGESFVVDFTTSMFSVG